MEGTKERLKTTRAEAANTLQWVCVYKDDIERETCLTQNDYNTADKSLERGIDQAIEQAEE